MPHPVAGFIILPDHRAGLVLGEIGHIVGNMEPEVLPGVQNLMHHLEHRQMIKWRLNRRRRLATKPPPKRPLNSPEPPQIILANRPARHFLGGISLQTPFDRPTGVRFLDREDLARRRPK